MTTAVQVQYRRGTAAQVASFTGAQGELIVDTTTNRVVVQDGSTAGGWPAARLVDIPGGAKNIFRNGTMDIWQRGTAPITVSTAGSYAADGWIVVPSGASCGAQVGAGRLLTARSLQVYGGTGVTGIIIKQRIESFAAARLTSQTITVQAQVWNSTGAAITPMLTVKHAGAADNWTSPVTDVSAAALQSCAAGAWTQLAYSFIDTGHAVYGLEVSFDFGNNFSTSSKSIQLAECDISVTPALPTGLNGGPPLPELRSLASELALCQRYFSSSYNLDTAPGTATTVGAQSIRIDDIGSGAFGLQLAFPCRMRASPTVTFYSPNSGAAGYIFDHAGAIDLVATSTLNIGEGGALGVFGTSSSALYAMAHYTASAEL